jgi:hypothetical protein
LREGSARRVMATVTASGGVTVCIPSMIHAGRPGRARL